MRWGSFLWPRRASKEEDAPPMPTPPYPVNPLDPYLTKQQILDDLGINASTLDAWIKRGDFPKPYVLNPGQRREIIGWLTSEYLAWKVARPRRQANIVTDRAYEKKRRKRKQPPAPPITPPE
jgi:predicted DNA-binding transcriptional regulator AlpA